MYAKFLNKLEYERRLYNNLSESYFKIEDQVEFMKSKYFHWFLSFFSSNQKEAKRSKISKQGSSIINSLSCGYLPIYKKFHIDRCRDQYPKIQGQKATIRSQDNVIKNLQKIIQEHARKVSKQDYREMNVKVRKLQHDQKILKEKHKQVILSANS